VTADNWEAPELGGRALWYPDGDDRAWIGGWDERGDASLYPANTSELAILSACDGRRTLPDLARITDLNIEDVTHILAKWREQLPGSLLYKMVIADDKAAKQAAAAERMLWEARAVEALPSTVDNRSYYANAIADATNQFDHHEVTVSHAYSSPHPALANRSYGEVFFEECYVRGAVRPPMRILEIGCGTGRFARAFLDQFARRAPGAYRTARYTMFDLSPVLTASQRELTAAHASQVVFGQGDIETHAFSDQFDLVIANEVIADLSVEVVDKNRASECVWVSKYDLSYDGALRWFLVNAGAIRLLEQVAGVLSPGGCAIVTEYGARDAFPVAIEVEDHTEHSIHFGHLVQAARSLGLAVTCENLATFLSFDVRCEVIATDSLILLRELSPRLFGRELPTFAYTRAQLRDAVGDELDRILNLRFVPIRDRSSFMSPERFQALQLTRS
jgi:SAM-dependent methyltransferase